MKVLTAAETRLVDARTIERGIPGLILMENAAHRVVEAMGREFGDLTPHRFVILCGKGNNGGDGLAIARILHTAHHPASLDVVLAAEPAELRGDAATNYAMLRAAGIEPQSTITSAMRRATLLVDALLGTGASGAPRGRIAELIAEINSGFPDARVVAVDLPSGLDSDQPDTATLAARADFTVTFTALKHAHALPPNCDRMGKIVTANIGSPADLLADIPLEQTEPAHFRHLFAPRARNAHKGTYGHVLVIGGAHGKAGAAHMAGLAALRAGAGLVTVACDDSRNFPPELMTELLPGSLHRKSIVAIGPGLGLDHRDTTRELFRSCPLPMVCDADALNSLAGSDFQSPGPLRVLTPHPGEMSRLAPDSLQLPRLALARTFAQQRQVVLVLKGQRTLIAFPDGRVFINPTGTPALATGGSGDILTGLLAGFLAQFPAEPQAAILAAVYLHGLAAELGVRTLGELSLIATDVLQFLPAAIRDVSH